MMREGKDAGCEKERRRSILIDREAAEDKLREGKRGKEGRMERTKAV